MSCSEGKFDGLILNDISNCGGVEKDMVVLVSLNMSPYISVYLEVYPLALKRDCSERNI